MTPADKLRQARRLVAYTMGIDEAELPPDAEVEIATDAGGNVHVRGVVVAKGYVPSISCELRIS